MSGVYPILDDPEFNLKIHAKKEFGDYKYSTNITNKIKEEFDNICNADFELTNHQVFVKNYLSPNTPYNSILLYHGLGTGKTCSAINICEEVRRAYKQTGFNKKIIIVASPNVQSNFKAQLFDERKLESKGNVWTIRNSCMGETLLKAVYPTQYDNLTKEKIVSSVNKFIDMHYHFMGYVEFANYIKKHNNSAAHLKKEFGSRLIVIDEIHNLKSAKENAFTYSARYLQILIENVKELKFVFLTATPMFNSHSEIVWLLNLMRMNDMRPQLEEKEIFDTNGNLKINKETGEEVGKAKFIDFSRGYISFIRGENPYSFPYRIWPMFHSPEKSYLHMDFKSKYPVYSITGKLIPKSEYIEYTDLYLSHVNAESLQEKTYYAMKKFIMQQNKNINALNYEQVAPLVQILNFVFPPLSESAESSTTVDVGVDVGVEETKADDGRPDDGRPDDDTFPITPASVTNFYGTKGLNNIMVYNNGVYKYKPETLTKYNNIFHPDNIGKYSHKLQSLSNCVINSDGIVLIYSQYIDGGLIPVALMLEEMGYTKYNKHGGKNLLDLTNTNMSKSTKPLVKKSSSYIIISGTEKYSPNNTKEVSVATDDSNKNGEIIKVVLISKAGSEGIDFKNIRQVHILDPWYNLNRNEQIIGRGVRMCSHKLLPFQKRNVSIYFHTTILSDENEESCDLYVYRLAEIKAKKIAKVARLLKQNAIDCMLNHKQTLLTEENFNTTIQLRLSNQSEIDYSIGDKKNSNFCDYDICDYSCFNNKNISSTAPPLSEDLSTYNPSFMENNSQEIIAKIKNIFTSHEFITKTLLLTKLQKYPSILVDYSLQKIINDQHIVYDSLERPGYLEILAEFIIYKPKLLSKHSTIFDRIHPPHHKHDIIEVDHSGKFREDITRHPANSHSLRQLTQLFINLYKKNTDGDILTKNQVIFNETLHQLADFGFTHEDLHDVTCSHLLDTADSSSIISTMNEIFEYVSQNSSPPTMTFPIMEEDLSEHYVCHVFYNYIIKNTLEIADSRVIIVNNLDKTKGFIYTLQNNKWVEAKRTLINEYKSNQGTKLESLIEKLKQQTNIVGFYSGERKNVFKLKSMEAKNNKGFNCRQAEITGKRDNIIAIVRNLVPLFEPIITLKNVDTIFEELKLKDDKPTKDKEQKMNKLCTYLELLLRLADKHSINDNTWFFNIYHPFTVDSFVNTIKK